MAAVLPIGFTSLDFDNRADIHIHARTYLDDRGDVQLDLHTWGDTVLYSAQTNFLDVLALPSRRNFQCGSFNSTQTSSSRIYFATPFDATPRVIVWLNGFNIASTGASYRVTASPLDINPSSFVLEIRSWDDTTFRGASVYWIAIPSNQSDIASGIFYTEELRRWQEWRLNNSRAITFDKPFPTIPRVVAAFHGFDIGGDKNIRASVTISDVSTTQFTWHLDGWGDTAFYDAWGSYIAAVDPPSTSVVPTVVPTPSPIPSSKANLGVIIGSTIGGLVAIAVLIVLYLFYRRRHRSPRSIAAPLPTGLSNDASTGPRGPVSFGTSHITPFDLNTSFDFNSKRSNRSVVLSNGGDENADTSTPAPIITQYVDSGIRTVSDRVGPIIELPPVYTSVNAMLRLAFLF